MSCRTFWVGLLLFLVAFTSVDAVYLVQVQYIDPKCTTPSGAYLYAPLPDTTPQECAELAGKCAEDAGPIIPHCVDADPLLSVPADHVAAVAYNNIDQCNGGNYTYFAAIAGPFKKCVFASVLGYFKAGGCGTNQNATGTFYASAADCETNFNGTTYSYPPNSCLTALGGKGIKFVCPSAAPVAPPVVAPVAVPVSTSAPTRKSSSSISNATIGWISFAAAWITALL